MKKLGADLKLGQELIRQNSAGLAEIGHADFAKHASAPSEGRPSSLPILFHPDRQKQRSMVIADRVRATGKKNPGKKGDVETKCVLVQKAVFCGKLYVAHPESGAAGPGLIKARGQGRCELKVRRRTVVEIYSGLAAGAVARIRSVVERVYLELMIRGRFGIVGHE